MRTEDVVTFQFVTASGVPGSCVISQVSAGRKNRLYLEVSGSEGTFGFDQEDPERLWVGGRDGSGYVVRDPDVLHPDAARYARVPAGHPQGYQDCFDALRRRHVRRHRRATHRTGCRPSPTGSAPP